MKTFRRNGSAWMAIAGLGILLTSLGSSCSNDQPADPGDNGGSGDDSQGGRRNGGNAQGGNKSGSAGSSGRSGSSTVGSSGNAAAGGSGNGTAGGSSKGGGSGTAGNSAKGGSSGTSGGSAKGGSNGGTDGGLAKGGSNVTDGGSGKGGSSGAGGAAQGDGSVGGGGANPSAKDLKCDDPMYGSVSIPAVNVISDFEDGTTTEIVQDGRGQGADPWHAYAVDDVNDDNGEMKTPSAVNPKNSANIFKVDPSVHGPCSSKGALHVTSPGKAGDGSYAGFGIDFMARTGSTRRKQSYDASKYTGIGFWAKCAKDLQFAYFKAVDGNQDADVSPAPCSYSSDPKCNQYGIKNAAITKDWTYYKLYFSELLQDPNGSNFTDGVDKTKLTAFQIHVNPFSPRSDSGGTTQANAFDCYIDDVHFLSEPAPTTPTASVSWSTSTNKISRNGSDYKIRGLVRPSMEWDCAGFAITREDIKRMKTWKPNAIRLAVSDKLWAGAQTGGASCNGGAYQKEVKRVVSWILQEGMDVIFDLHYVSGSPNADNASFWSKVSADPFFQDPRIIYELFNEPTDGQPNLHDWMQSTVSSIRSKAKDNLILVSGPDYTYDISYYVDHKITGDPIAYVTHPYRFKRTDGTQEYLTPAQSIPVIATEFGDAKVAGVSDVPADKCEASVYSDYINKFENAGMSWTSWAWIVDAWGCGFPQLIGDYSGTPNAIGTPVQTQLKALNP